MALTAAQRGLCRLIAANRIERGESYVAGGAALNVVLETPRVSRDIDLFHDPAEALRATWQADRALLAGNGYDIEVVHERPAYVEAVVRKGGQRILTQWAQDSAFRFFPLVRHEDLGLTLHPFDLATNKALALVGRLEPRDWLDLAYCHERLQPLGYLLWAACGKDVGYSPALILQEARRTTHYSAGEMSELTFDGEPPDGAAVARKWRAALDEADHLIDRLPPDQAGRCALDTAGRLFRGGADELAAALKERRVRFHRGSIGGALPTIVG